MYEYNGEQLPQVSVSASKDGNGNVNVSLCNISPSAGANVEVHLRGKESRKGTIYGTILTSSDMHAHNTFGQPEAVKPAPFYGVTLTGQGFTAALPPMSVVVLTIKY
jgi:alpha-N-arabinofuranosidase